MIALAIVAALIGAAARYNKGAAFPTNPPFPPADIGAWFIESEKPGEWSLRPWWKAIGLLVGGAGPAYAICPDPWWVAAVVGVATMCAGLQGHHGLDLLHRWSWADAGRMALSGVLYVAPMAVLLLWVACGLDTLDSVDAFAAATLVLAAGAAKPIGYLLGTDPRANAFHGLTVAAGMVAAIILAT